MNPENASYMSGVDSWVWWILVAVAAVIILWIISMSAHAKDWVASSVKDKAGIGKNIGVIAVLLVLINYLLAKFDFEWWWAMWDHGPFFWVNVAILVCCAIAMSKVGKLAKAGALLMMAFALAGWIKVSSETPTRAEAADAARQAQAPPVPPPPPVPAMRETEVPVEKGQWFEVPLSRFVTADAVKGVRYKIDGGPEKKLVDKFRYDRRALKIALRSDTDDFVVTMLVPD